MRDHLNIVCNLRHSLLLVVCCSENRENSPEDLRVNESTTPLKKRRFTQHSDTLISSSLSPSPNPLSSPLTLSSSSPTQSEPISEIKSDPEDLRLSSVTPVPRSEGSKVPTWTQTQLQEAIEAVITQRMRFTQVIGRGGEGWIGSGIMGRDRMGWVGRDQKGVREKWG